MVTDDWNEWRARRIALYRARFLSWKLGRAVALPPWVDHWWHMPMVWADTGDPISVVM